MNIKVGCSGFPIERKEYYRKFQTVELLETFYQVPDIEAVAKWKAVAPKYFEFVVKAWKLITHEGLFRPTDEVMEAWRRTEEIASRLGSRTILFQTPAAFTHSPENISNIKKFFGSIERKNYNFVWELENDWPGDTVKDLCAELDLTHCTDPFSGPAREGKIRYFRLSGIGGKQHKYKGIDLKRLRDFCENEAEAIKNGPVYVFFSNVSMLADAQRFDWILENTGRIKEINISFLKDLCHKIESVEEDENVKRLSQEAERIVTLILHTDYARVDIEIEKSKLRELCKELFPGKEYLYEMIYGQRFDRLWEQFREEADEIET
ncbi:DUF72 domain-containing protein [Candidatus Omnitrophota bacterium]